MEIKEAIEILENHNYWRRDNSVPSETEMISPKELGIAIDKIVEHFKNNVLLHNVRLSFNSIEKAVNDLNLNKRVRWFTLNDELCRKGKYYAEPVIVNGQPVIIYKA